MVTIDVPIYPNHAASIRAGLDPDATSVPVDLDEITQQERDLLADHSGQPLTVTTPTVEDLFDALRTAAAEEQTTLTEILDAHRVVLQERRVTTWRDGVPAGQATYAVTRPDWPDARGGTPDRRDWAPVMAKHHAKVHQITHGPEATEWMREIETLNAESREQARQTQRDADQARQSEHEQAIARLREWAIANGSERVRLLIEEDMNSWLHVAEDEFYEAHTPEGFAPLTDEDYVRSLPAPDAPDIHTLREARLIAATDECLGDPMLVWIGQPTGSDQTPGGPAVRLTITGPHGGTCVVWRWVGGNFPETSNEPQQTTPEPDTSGGWLNVDDLPPPTVAEAIEELRQLLDDFEDVRMDQMTTMFYIHAFNELTMSGRQLLEALGDDPPS